MNNAFDILVSGCGISGLAAAVSAAEEGMKVVVLSKEDKLFESSTFYAQGGIVSRGDEDSSKLLYDDIMNAGSWINSEEAVNLVSTKGPDIVEEYLQQKAQVPFCTDESGHILKTREAAHSVRRILYHDDATGKSIETSLLTYAQNNPNITFLNNKMVVDLITSSHNSRDIQQRYRKTKVIGAYVLDVETQHVSKIFASDTILATGGVGRAFTYTSNPKGATGDGIAIAYRAGAEIINAEYLQFHPTTLFHRDADNFLLTEALRGEGARLMNRQGEYFMKRYCPEMADLAPRDEVSRAIWKEMERSKSTYVYLDTTQIKNIDIKKRFPGIYEKCMSLGIDMTKNPVPVVPAAHYFCGGIKTDTNGVTSIDGLMSVGESACNGVHGANRLASVSLLEGLVFGVRAGKEARRRHKDYEKELMASIPDWVYPYQREEFDSILIRNDMESIQTTMWNYSGIIRTKKRLERAISDLNFMSHRIEKFYKEATMTREIVELRNIVVVAQLIVKAAFKNTKSIGSHYIDEKGI